MNISHITKIALGIAATGILLAGCSGSTGTSTTTGANVDQTTATQQPSSSPQSYVTPTSSPATTDSTTSKPALSSKDDAASLNTDLNNTTVSDESFN